MKRREWGEPLECHCPKPSIDTIPMREGHMYQIIGGKVVEVVRDGDKLVPIAETIELPPDNDLSIVQ